MVSRFGATIVTICFPVVLSGTACQAALFRHGVASGDVTDTSAVIWGRAERAATLVVEYATTPDFSNREHGGTVRVSAETDFTGTVLLTGLTPATRYYYRLRPQEGTEEASATGTFATAPSPDAARDVSFLWGGDLGGQGFCRRPEYTIFTAMKALAADFFLFGGDTIYADSLCPAPPNVPGADFIATTQQDFWAKHRYQREDRPLQELLAAIPVYAVWDDHEVRNDFSGRTEPLAPLGFKAFFDYFPIRRVPQEPLRLYRKFRWGKHLELFLLDTRQYRSPNLQLDGPNKTLLGATQLQWLLEGLVTSTATWKAIFSSVPLSTHTGSALTGRDGWGGDLLGTGFTTELAKIFTHIRARHVQNVIWFSTDLHVARLLSYDPEQDGTVDFYECISGPLSAITGNLDPLDHTFHPRILYEETNFLNFGVVRIDGHTGQLTVEIRDQEGEVHYELSLSARGVPTPEPSTAVQTRTGLGW
jgi:alkaline phosphatase D